MRRVPHPPRPRWQDKVEELGLLWHSTPRPYWNESARYELTVREVEVLEAATNELEPMALVAAQHVIDERLYAQLGIPERAISLIEASWEAEPPSLYGRFDFAYDGSGPPKLLEYNADTPTTLLESAVVQWHWLEEMFPRADQFNSIHERLIALFRELAPFLPGRCLDLCSMDDVEDGMTVTYLQDTARQAGIDANIFPLEEIGWNGLCFVDPEERPLSAVFKLYPWEWMIREEFARHLSQSHVLWMEPAWKMLLSNKGILPVLWKLFPGHPNLLEASFDGPGAMRSWVRKPLLGREGANIVLHEPGAELQTSGDYGEEGFVFQQRAPLRSFDGHYPVIGSWVLGHAEGDVAAGVGIRESDSPITTETARFVPHVFA